MRDCWRHRLDSSGNNIQVSEYKIRYISPHGAEMTKEEYEMAKLDNIEVYKAAFAGCTYHCG